MSQPKRKRNRGVILTPKGLKKLQLARLKSEHQANFDERYTYEQISELTRLDVKTVKKVLDAQEGVDKRSLEKFCLAFELQLVEEFYTKPNSRKRYDWGEAVAVDHFFGRVEELSTISNWLLNERCRLITLLGMGGIGKTALSIKLAQQVAVEFDCVIWKSLREVPPLEEIVTYLIEFISEGRETGITLPARLGDKISRLIDYLRSQRCLILLDNVESLMDSNNRAGNYCPGYEEYGEFFRRIGSTVHDSCLLLTTREKPKEVAVLEGDRLLIRSWRLEGLKQCQEIIRIKGLSGSELDLISLCDRYNGNPLALKMVTATIKDLFAGNIAEFLRQEKTVFGDIRELLDQQFSRLSDLEQEVMYWIAIARKPVSWDQLQEDIVSRVSATKLLEALESLSRRSLIEKSKTSFTQQSVIMEYLTSRLVENIAQEIFHLQPKLLSSYALIKATSEDYIRESQLRLILKPLIKELLSIFRFQKDLEKHLRQFLRLLQSTSPLEKSYAAGNIINLLCCLGTDLTGYDFSNLSVWQADLRQATLHQVNFQNADLSKSVFAENFGGIWSVAFSPDGQYLAAGDTKGDIILRRVADGQPILRFKGHEGWVVSLDFNLDGDILASSSCDCTAKLWDVNTGKCLYTLAEHQQEVWSVAFSPDGNTLATGCDDGNARIWDVSSGRRLKVFQGHKNEVLSVAFNVDGQQLISGSQDKTIRLWEIETAQCKQILQGHDDGVRSLSLSPNGQVLASGSSDRTIRLWEIKTGRCLKVFQGHKNVVMSVSFSPRDNLLASSSIGQEVRLWNIDTSECLKIFQNHSNTINSIDFNPQGNILASGSYDQSIKLWNINTYQCIKTWQGYSNQILSVAFSPDSKTIASGGHDKKVRLWNVNGQITKTLCGHTNWVLSVAYSPSNNLLASGSADKTVKIWDIHTGIATQTLWGHDGVVRSIAFTSDGKTLASCSEDRTIKLWDINTGKVRKNLEGHQADIWSIAIGSNSQILASASLDSTIRLWNIQEGKYLKTLNGHESWVWSVAFSPDGHTLASTSADQTIRLWDVNSGECLRTLRDDMGHSQVVAFSPDGQTLASYDLNHNIRLWETNGCMRTLHGHKALINSIVFSLDGNTLASSSEDKTIKLWNLRNNQCLKTLKPKNPYEEMNVSGVNELSQTTIEALEVLGAVNNSIETKYSKIQD